MNPYSNTCHHCKSPAKRNRNVLICSNVKCKSWRKVRKTSADINIDYSILKQKQGIGLTPDDPIIIRCDKCDNICSPAMGNFWAQMNIMPCHYCSNRMIYEYIKERWYYTYHHSQRCYYITKYIGNDRVWNFDTEIMEMES